MPSPSYAQNKTHIYKWREANADKNRELCRKSSQKYRNWKKVQKEFLSILLF
jgi:hypothetical protein